MNYQEIIEQEMNKLCPNQTLIGFDEEFAIRLMKSAVSQAEQDKWIDVKDRIDSLIIDADDHVSKEDIINSLQKWSEELLEKLNSSEQK